MPLNPTDLIGPGAFKLGSKALEALGVPCHGVTEALEEMTSSPAYMKHRIDDATDKIQDFWDNHKEDVSDFFDNVGESISDGLDSVADGIGDFFTSLF